MDILDKSRELDRLRKEQEEVLIEINKMHKKLQASKSIKFILFCLNFFFFYVLIVLLIKEFVRD